MHGTLLVLAIMLWPVAAQSDRPVTAEERAAIVAALEAEGCSGGEYEYDDDDEGEFEVDDAQCADGMYDFELSSDFRITDRDRED
jgi:hypothetical protein